MRVARAEAARDELAAMLAAGQAGAPDVVAAAAAAGASPPTGMLPLAGTTTCIGCVPRAKLVSEGQSLAAMAESAVEGVVSAAAAQAARDVGEATTLTQAFNDFNARMEQYRKDRNAWLSRKQVREAQELLRLQSGEVAEGESAPVEGTLTPRGRHGGAHHWHYPCKYPRALQSASACVTACGGTWEVCVSVCCVYTPCVHKIVLFARRCSPAPPPSTQMTQSQWSQRVVHHLPLASLWQSLSCPPPLWCCLGTPTLWRRQSRC